MPAERRRSQQWGLLAGPLLAALAWLALPDAYPGLDGELVPFAGAGRTTAAVAVWMATWWLSEAISVYATALLPLVLLPLLSATSMQEAASPYAHELIFLFMGGFLIALTMERWGLHRRIALVALRLVGARPDHIVGGFMAVTALLSMWVSNTATAVMMLPVAISVIALARARTTVRRRATSPSACCSGSPTAPPSEAWRRRLARRRTCSCSPTWGRSWAGRSASCAGWGSGCRWSPSSCPSPGCC
jgi:sodium-dependent dicarboxylate transporter 2/3/5